MSATSKSLEEKIDEEVKKRVRLKLRLWTKFIYSALDRWEEICDDGDVLPGEGQSESRSDPAAAQLEEDNTETDDSAAGTECTERDMEETLTKFMTSPNDVNVEDAEEDDDGDSNVEESDDIDRSYNFDTLRSSSPNRTEECGDIAEDECPASGRISDLLHQVPLARDVEEDGNYEVEEEYQISGVVENENIENNLEAQGPVVEPPPQAAELKRKVANTPCPYCYKMFRGSNGVKIHISKSRYCEELRMQRMSGYMGDDDGPSAVSTPISAVSQHLF